MCSSTWWVFIFVLVGDIDSTLAKADSSFIAQSSMVAENLRRMEMKEEALKSESKTALRKAAVTAVGGK
jgi:hypothetical protein